MANQPTRASTASLPLQATQVFGAAVICLMAGLTIGYMLRGSTMAISPAQRGANTVSPPTAGTAMGGRSISVPQEIAQAPAGQAHPVVDAAPATHAAGAAASGPAHTPRQMKEMADRQAAPLLEKLKSDPNNVALLTQVGAIYHVAQQFTEAASWYGRALQIEPRNVALRTRLASSLYRNGDVDGALAQLDQGLHYEPNDANSLFDLGLIKLNGKGDSKGALAAWQKLLKTNPQLSTDRKDVVQKQIAGVLTMMGDQNGIKGAGSNDGRKSKSN